MPKKKSLSERIDKALSEWGAYLGLTQSWEIGFLLVDKLDTTGPGGHEAAARISIKLPYRRAEITVAKCMENYSNYDLEQSMLHELLHIPLATIMSYIQGAVGEDVQAIVKDQIEDVVDFMTRVILRINYEKKGGTP